MLQEMMTDPTESFHSMTNSLNTVFPGLLDTQKDFYREDVLQDPAPLEERIPAPATFWIKEAAKEFQTVAAVETGIRGLWATLGDLQAGRAITISADAYNLLLEVISEDFDRIVKHLNGPVHHTFVSRLGQIRHWIGVENFGAFRTLLNARLEPVPTIN